MTPKVAIWKENPELGTGERQFLDGSLRRVAKLPSVTIGWGEYQPGWRWSTHVGAQTGVPSMAHIGYLLSGQMRVRAANGEETLVQGGEAFEVGPGHDAWVVGDRPCIALDFAQVASGPPVAEEPKG